MANSNWVVLFPKYRGKNHHAFGHCSLGKTQGSWLKLYQLYKAQSWDFSRIETSDWASLYHKSKKANPYMLIDRV